MLINWANLGAIIALLTFVIMLIRSLIVTPMKEAIADLKMSVQHLDEVITNQRERIAKVEASSAAELTTHTDSPSTVIATSVPMIQLKKGV